MAHIYGYVYHINNINCVNQIVRSKSYWTCPYSGQYLYYLVILTNLEIINTWMHLVNTSIQNINY